VNGALCKVCEIEDFDDGPVADEIRTIFAHEPARFGPGFPRIAAYRKHWEVAMAVMALRAGGLLDRGGTALGVGAGNEPTLFWLTRWLQVHAIDLYLDPENWAESANPSMLVDPGRHWPGDWRPQRLIVQHMDARQLRYENHSFDAVFSSSSIEHFGSDREIGQALDEIHRVLRPGGICSISTEYRISGEGPGLPGVRMFDLAEIRRIVIDGRDWEPLTPFAPTASQATLATEVLFAEAARDVREHIAHHGELVFHALRFSRYPQIVLRAGDKLWTSVHLALRKRS
jgi:SAM-dependent methyltransferase